ncbi:MAG: rhomboid family intramembrane serine protease [Fimbriimonadales bacterium]
MKPTKVPYASIALILVTLVVAAFALGSEQSMWDWGFIPKPFAKLGLLERAEKLFSSLFLHVEPMHLLGNMVILAGVGPVVEQVLGSLRFSVVYVVSGVVGALLHAVMVSVAQASVAGEPLVGASACIGGLIGYSWLRFYRASVPVFPKVKVPVYLLVGAWVLLQLFGAVAANRMFGAPIAYWAHIGGFFAGFLFALVFKAGQQARGEAWRERLDEAAKQGPASQVSAAREYLRAHPNDSTVAKALVEGLIREQRQDDAVSELKKLASSSPSFENGYALLRLRELGRMQALSVDERLRIAKAVLPDAPDAAEAALSSILEEPTSSKTADALMMLLEIAGKSDKHGAKVYADQLAREFALDHRTEAAKRVWPELF